jgi:hypothetical protein
MAYVPLRIGPFTHEVSQVLRLSNPTSAAIAFKVKTTAPKQYVHFYKLNPPSHL